MYNTPMTLKVRTIKPEEAAILDQWQRADNVVGYRRARVLRLSAKSWSCADIAEALGLHVHTVRDTIKTFNQGGVAALAPQPRSGGPVRSKRYTPEMAETVERLVRQGPPDQQNRTSWTLHSLAKSLADRFEPLSQVSHEAIRRLLAQREIVYRQAKSWITSPDPLYELRKGQRERLLALARSCADGVAVWLDESWFIRWPYSYRAWNPAAEPLRVPQRWDEDVDKTALFAALDDESQESFLHWAEGQPNSQVMISFLEKLMAHWTEQGKRFIVLFWDKASWHTSYMVKDWIREYNRRAKKQGLTRLIICQHPTRSPWLMPLEAIFGWIKHHVLGGRLFDTVAELQLAVERYFRQRVAAAKERHDRAWRKALSPT